LESTGLSTDNSHPSNIDINNNNNNDNDNKNITINANINPPVQSVNATNGSISSVPPAYFIPMNLPYPAFNNWNTTPTGYAYPSSDLTPQPIGNSVSHLSSKRSKSKGRGRGSKVAPSPHSLPSLVNPSPVPFWSIPMGHPVVAAPVFTVGDYSGYYPIYTPPMNMTDYSTVLPSFSISNMTTTAEGVPILSPNTAQAFLSGSYGDFHTTPLVHDEDFYLTSNGPTSKTNPSITTNAIRYHPPVSINENGLAKGKRGRKPKK